MTARARLLSLSFVVAALCAAIATAQATSLIRIDPSPRAGDGWSEDPVVSADARFVAFANWAVLHNGKVRTSNVVEVTFQ
jgi:predicted pyridoxine 5'-phosphate oxidase superfamily flavin-nucleotide-binding protein